MRRKDPKCLHVDSCVLGIIHVYNLQIEPCVFVVVCLCLGHIHAERMRFSGKQNMREVPVMACDFLTVSDILEICVVHECCEITCDFLTAPDFLGKQFLNPT